MVFGITMPPNHPNLWVSNDSHLIWCDLRSQHKTDTGREAQDTADHDHLLDGSDAQRSDISDIFSGQELAPRHDVVGFIFLHLITNMNHKRR